MSRYIIEKGPGELLIRGVVPVRDLKELARFAEKSGLHFVDPVLAAQKNVTLAMVPGGMIGGTAVADPAYAVPDQTQAPVPRTPAEFSSGEDDPFAVRDAMGRKFDLANVVLQQTDPLEIPEDEKEDIEKFRKEMEAGAVLLDEQRKAESDQARDAVLRDLERKDEAEREFAEKAKAAGLPAAEVLAAELLGSGPALVLEEDGVEVVISDDSD